MKYFEGNSLDATTFGNEVPSGTVDFKVRMIR